MKIKDIALLQDLNQINTQRDKKVLVTTVNAHSFNVSQGDVDFAEALSKSDFLLPDGVGIVLATNFLLKKKIVKIAGDDLFKFQMHALNERGGTCLFLGSTVSTLKKIKTRASEDYPNIRVETYSPPYKTHFSEMDNEKMLEVIRNSSPDILWVGMTAPKQEKWAYQNLDRIEMNGVIGCIGAVFDFYAGNVKRAPSWMINWGLEWFYRLVSEPKRMWKRYILGNSIFLINITREFFAD